MKTKFITTGIAALTFALIALLTYSGGIARKAFLAFFSGDRAALAQEAGTSKVIFKVKCYDDGKAALRGLKGVQRSKQAFITFMRRILFITTRS